MACQLCNNTIFVPQSFRQTFADVFYAWVCHVEISYLLKLCLFYVEVFYS